MATEERNEVAAQAQRIVDAVKREIGAIGRGGDELYSRAMVRAAAWMLSGVMALDPENEPATILRWANDDMLALLDENTATLMRGKAH